MGRATLRPKSHTNTRIEFISEVANPPNTNTYGYDVLDRLTSAVLPTTPYAYGYDAVGNRTSKTAGRAAYALRMIALARRPHAMVVCSHNVAFHRLIPRFLSSLGYIATLAGVAGG